MISSIRENASDPSNSRTFSLQLCPSRIKSVDFALSVFERGVGGDQFSRIADDCGIFKSCAFGLQQFLRFGNSLFDGGILPGFKIREFFLLGRSCSLVLGLYGANI